MVRRVPRGIFLFFCGVVLAAAVGIPVYASSSATHSPQNSIITTDDYNLLELTKRDREQLGIKPLKLNQKLLNSAIGKCQDMVTQNYWGHISPQGRGMEVFLAKAGINNFSKAAENLATGQNSLDEVNNDWM